VVDGNLISSRTPADLPQFMKALIAALRDSRVASQEAGSVEMNASSRAKRGTYSGSSRKP
jgi:hypothetical protein